MLRLAEVTVNCRQFKRTVADISTACDQYLAAIEPVMSGRRKGQIVIAVFVSYRRDDTAAVAAHLRDLLGQRLLPGSVFVDQSELQPGVAFPDRLAEAVESARVVVVLIGQQWCDLLKARNKPDETDFVRCEVERALARQPDGCFVLPVLVDGARMCALQKLAAAGHDWLAPLAKLSAFELLRHAPHEYAALVQRIAGLVPERAAQPQLPAGVPRIRNRSARELNRLCSAHYRDPTHTVDGLAQQLASASLQGRVARAVLCGGAGTGKTQAVLKFVQQFEPQYAGIWWFEATAGGLARGAQSCAAQLGLDPAPEVDSIERVRNALEACEERWLLIVEDVGLAERDDVLRLLPDSSCHHVVLTSTEPDWPRASVLTMKGWSPSASADYLEERVQGATAAELRALGEALSGLPLALHLAACHISKQGCSAADYIRLLRTTASSRDLMAQTWNDDAGRPRSLLGIVRLACDTLSPAALGLLQISALGASEWLPERCLHEAADALPAPLAAATRSAGAWLDVRGELVRSGLVRSITDVLVDTEGDVPPREAEPLLRVDTLTQRALLTLLDDAAPQWEAMAVVLTRACERELAQQPVHWPRLRLLAQHAQAFGARRTSPVIAAACRLAATIFDATGDPYSALPGWEHWKAVCEATLADPRDEVRLSAQSNYAHALLLVRQFGAAEDWARHVLALRDDPVAESTLTKALLHQARVAEALSVAAGRARRLGHSGAEPAEALDALTDLAEALRRDGRLDVARAVQERIVTALRPQGDESESMLDAQHNLAATCFELGEHSVAGDLRRTVLTARRNAWPPQPRKHGLAALHLAHSLEAEADARAGALFDEAATQLALTLTANDPLLLDALAGVARHSTANHGKAGMS